MSEDQGSSLEKGDCLTGQNGEKRPTQNGKQPSAVPAFGV